MATAGMRRASYKEPTASLRTSSRLAAVSTIVLRLSGVVCQRVVRLPATQLIRAGFSSFAWPLPRDCLALACAPDPRVPPRSTPPHAAHHPVPLVVTPRTKQSNTTS
jgi:hypothetical protein